MIPVKSRKYKNKANEISSLNKMKVLPFVVKLDYQEEMVSTLKYLESSSESIMTSSTFSYN